MLNTCMCLEIIWISDPAKVLKSCLSSLNVGLSAANSTVKDDSCFYAKEKYKHLNSQHSKLKVWFKFFHIHPSNTKLF